MLTPVTTSLWLGILGLSAVLAAVLEWHWLSVPPFALGLLALHELLAFGVFGKGLFPSRERVARVYQWFKLFMDGHETADFARIGDLTEGFFNGDFGKTIDQATSDKYDEIVRLLGLEKGHRVLDVGCGLGDLLLHLRQKGIDGVGLTVSPDQQRIARSRGLDVRVLDFRGELPADLQGRFDAVLFVGCLEHFVEGYSIWKPSQQVRSVYQKTFESAWNALSANSSVRRVFTSTQHGNPDFEYRLRDHLHCYLLHGHYSGYYPVDGMLQEAGRPYFELFHRYDATLDYRFSSLTTPRHFGRFKIDWTIERVLLAVSLVLVNPFAWATWLYYACGTWMWQFGGPDVTDGRSPTRTLWLVFSAPASADRVPFLSALAEEPARHSGEPVVTLAAQ